MLLVLSSVVLVEVVKGGSYVILLVVVSIICQFGVVFGVVVMVILIGKLEYGIVEEVLWCGWVMVVICFIVVVVVVVVLGRINCNFVQMLVLEFVIVLWLELLIFQLVVVLIEYWVVGDVDLLGNLLLFVGLDVVILVQFGEYVEDVELEVGCYFFYEGDLFDLFYVICMGCVQVLQDSIVFKELGCGEVFGEFGLFIDVFWFVMVWVLCDIKLVWFIKVQFDEIVDYGVLVVLVKVLVMWLWEVLLLVIDLMLFEVVVLVIGVSGDVFVLVVVVGLFIVLLVWLCVVDFGWVDCDGFDCVE